MSGINNNNNKDGQNNTNNKHNDNMSNNNDDNKNNNNKKRRKYKTEPCLTQQNQTDIKRFVLYQDHTPQEKGTCC